MTALSCTHSRSARAAHDAVWPAQGAPTPSAPDDARLVDRCLAGDEKAAEILVRSYSNLVYGIALRSTGRVEDAEDVTQEVFLRAFRSLHHLRGRSSLKAWLVSIALNQARTRMALIRRLRRLVVPLAPSTWDEEGDGRWNRVADLGQPGVEVKLMAEERCRLLSRAIEQLPYSFRVAVVLRDQLGLSYEEVAEATGVPVGTVRSRLARGRALLARHLSEPNAEERNPCSSPLHAPATTVSS